MRSAFCHVTRSSSCELACSCTDKHVGTFIYVRRSPKSPMRNVCVTVSLHRKHIPRGKIRPATIRTDVCCLLPLSLMLSGVVGVLFRSQKCENRKRVHQRLSHVVNGGLLPSNDVDMICGLSFGLLTLKSHILSRLV